MCATVHSALLTGVISRDGLIFKPHLKSLNNSCVYTPVACLTGCSQYLIAPCVAALSALALTEHVTCTNSSSPCYSALHPNVTVEKRRNFQTACPLLPWHHVLAYTFIFHYTSITTKCIQLTHKLDRTSASMSQAEWCLLSKFLLGPSSYNGAAATLLLLPDINSKLAFIPSTILRLCVRTYSEK